LTSYFKPFTSTSTAPRAAVIAITITIAIRTKSVIRVAPKGVIWTWSTEIQSICFSCSAAAAITARISAVAAVAAIITITAISASSTNRSSDGHHQRYNSNENKENNNADKFSRHWGNNAKDSTHEQAMRTAKKRTKDLRQGEHGSAWLRSDLKNAVRFHAQANQAPTDGACWVTVSGQFRLNPALATCRMDGAMSFTAARKDAFFIFVDFFRTNDTTIS